MAFSYSKRKKADDEERKQKIKDGTWTQQDEIDYNDKYEGVNAFKTWWKDTKNDAQELWFNRNN